MSDNFSVDQSELFELMYSYSESHNIGGTLQILDTLLHMLEMVVKSYTTKTNQTEEQRREQYARVREIIYAAKTAIGKTVRYCSILPGDGGIEKKLLEDLPVGVCVTDILGKIYFANSSFLQTTGLSKQNFGSVNIATLYTDAAQRRKIVSQMKESQLADSAVTFKIPFKKEGKEYLVESIERNIEWEGKRNCMLAVVIPRTEAHKVEQEIQKAVHGDVTIEQVLITVSERTKEKELEEAKRKRIEKDKQALLSFVNSLVNMVGNMIYLEDNIMGKEIYQDKLIRATNIGLFAVLTLNAFDEQTLLSIFNRKSHPRPVEHIKRDLLFGIILHDIGKLGIDTATLLKEETFTEDQKKAIVRDHVDIGANLVKTLKGPYSETIKVMAMYHHKSRDGAGSGYPQGFDNRLRDPREILVKWFDVFYSFVTRRPYRKDLMPYDQIVTQILFKDRDLQPTIPDETPENAYSPRIRLLLERLRQIFNPKSTNPAYLQIQEEIQKWMQRVRIEHDNAATRIELKKRLKRNSG